MGIWELEAYQSATLLSGDEMADELAKDGAEEDGGATAAGQFSDHQTAEENTFMLLWKIEHFFTSKRNGKTGMKWGRAKENTWQLVRKRREGRKHRTERCKNLCGFFKCMRCEKRSTKENLPGTCHGFK